MATVYTAREYQSTSIPIDEVLVDGQFDIFPEVQGKGYFDVRFQGTRLVITAGKFVGFIPLNSRVVIDVRPKMPVANLLSILSSVKADLAEIDVLQREYATAEESPPQIIQALARAYCHALEGIEVAGLLKAYAPATSAGSSLKGRPDFNASIQRFWSRGVRHAAVSRHYELNADLSSNRLLRLACQVLLTQHRLSGMIKPFVSRLSHFDELLERAGVLVTMPRRLDLVGDGSPAYKKALRLAVMIVHRTGIELSANGAHIGLPSFLIDMETVFEQYMRGVLSRQLSGCSVMDGNYDGAQPLFNDRRDPPANPDVVVRDESEVCFLIGEVKYKDKEKREDINQALAYASCYKCGAVVLMLPAERADDAGLQLIGRMDSVTLYRYRFDLAATSLADEEARCGAALVPLLSS